MSLFGDLKKIFFGAKSVAKHQAQKAGETAKETFDDLAEQATEKGGELLADAKEKFGEATEELREKGSEIAAQGKEALSELGEKVFKETGNLADKGAELKDKGTDWINERLGNLNTSADNSAADLESARLEGLEVDGPDRSATAGQIDYEAGLTEDPGLSQMPKAPNAAQEAANQALDAAAKAGLGAKATAEKLGGKIMDASEVVGEKILEKGSELLDRVAETGADLKSKAEDFIDHANTEAEKMKLEESIEEAKAAAEQAEARARAFDGKEVDKDTSESLLDGTDSFFDRAAKFADGDYHREGSIKITKNDDPTKVELTKKGKIDLSGFEDRDGDGDALIDDAELEEE